MGKDSLLENTALSRILSQLTTPIQLMTSMPWRQSALFVFRRDYGRVIAKVRRAGDFGRRMNHSPQP